MKKKFNVFGSLALSALVLMGSIFASCGQIAGTSSDDLSLALSAANPPTVLESWTTIANYASDGAGGGHSVYGNVAGTANGVFLSANYSDGSLGYSADNGLSWRNVDSTATTFGAGNYIKFLAYLNNTFFAVGKGGHIAWSADGLVWNAIVAPAWLSGDLYSIAVDGAGNYMIVGPNTVAALVQSPTSLTPTWTQVALRFPAAVDSVVYIGGQFVAVGGSGYISYTTDATYTVWQTPFQVRSPAGLNTNTFKMAAVGLANDGSNTIRNAVVAVSRYGLAYAFEGSLASASDWAWTEIYPSSSGPHLWLNCVVYGDGRFVVAGQDGGMAYSDPGQVNPLSVWTIDGNLAWTNGLFRGTYINGLAYKPGTAITNRYLATGGDNSPLGAWTRR
jgi:hypothetical protein